MGDRLNMARLLGAITAVAGWTSFVIALLISGSGIWTMKGPTIIVSFVVGAIFLLIGLVLHKIGHAYRPVSQELNGSCEVRRLGRWLCIGSSILLFALGFILLGVLFRLSEGYAVFG
ncbi:hypothetical protein WNZ14_09175 [Hoeflea sp. AS60]|uniref:hypothetical protein n=1 Tax=Hoeflea sp. AS60 TaxID=3135780 RepID=UPI00317EF205